jgi:hypothetical protein
MGEPNTVVMKSRSEAPALDLSAGELRLDRLLGRRVLAADNQAVGLLEEFRAEKRGAGYVITEYVIGAAGLLERLGVAVQRVLGKRAGGYVARWDQVDLTDPDRPRLTCPVSDLRTL